MQLVCKYGDDTENPDLGVVVSRIDDDNAIVDMSAFPGCVLLPFSGNIADLGKYGPEPRLLGEAPTAKYPTLSEIEDGEKAGHFNDPRGADRMKFLKSVAGQLVPDQRREKGLMEDDTRLPKAPDQSDPAVLKAYLAQVRWAKEVTGITAEGVPVATDRDSQGAIERAASRAARDPKFTVIWGGSDGRPYPLKSDQIVKIGDAVSDYVQACRDAEAAVMTAISAGKLKKLVEIDAAFTKANA